MNDDSWEYWVVGIALFIFFAWLVWAMYF